MKSKLAPILRIFAEATSGMPSDGLTPEEASERARKAWETRHARGEGAKEEEAGPGREKAAPEQSDQTSKPAPENPRVPDEQLQVLGPRRVLNIDHAAGMLQQRGYELGTKLSDSYQGKGADGKPTTIWKISQG